MPRDPERDTRSLLFTYELGLFRRDKEQNATSQVYVIITAASCQIWNSNLSIEVMGSIIVFKLFAELLVFINTNIFFLLGLFQTPIN